MPLVFAFNRIKRSEMMRKKNNANLSACSPPMKTEGLGLTKNERHDEVFSEQSSGDGPHTP